LIEDLIEKYSLFGGSEDIIELNLYKKDIFSNIVDLIESEFKDSIPFYLLQEPYRSFLITIAKNSNKIHSASIKSHLNKEMSSEIVNDLIENDIIRVIESREKPFRVYAKN